MVSSMCSIRVFYNFLLDPYYEPLPWFMITCTAVAVLEGMQSTRLSLCK